jgi:hypothetical protein
MGDVRAQAPAQGGQPVATVVGAVEDSQDPERFEQPAERGRVGVDRRGQLGRGHRPAREPIGHAQRGTDVEQLGDLVSAQERGHPVGRQ